MNMKVQHALPALALAIASIAAASVRNDALAIGCVIGAIGLLVGGALTTE